jgi:hypothetical protein
MRPRARSDPVTARVTLTPVLATTRTSTPSPNAAIAIVVNKAATLVIAGLRFSGISPDDRIASTIKKPTMN